MRRLVWMIAGILSVFMILAWLSLSVAYSVPDIRIGMAEQEVETVLGKPDMRTQEEGHSGVGVYPAAPGWLLGRHDIYIIVYDGQDRVARYDLIEHEFGHSRWTRR